MVGLLTVEAFESLEELCGHELICCPAVQTKKELSPANLSICADLSNLIARFKSSSIFW